MSQYFYKAKNKNQETLQGVIEADSESNAAELLLARDLAVIQVTRLKEFDLRRWFQQLTRHISKKDLAIFLRQLAILVSAAVPLVQSLRILAEQAENKGLQEALAEIVDEVEGGTKLSVALGRFPNIFNSYFVNMVKSGETSGKLDEILNYLAEQQEKEYELQSKISGALMYPAFILSVMVVAGIVMMLFVLPKMLTMFTDLGPGVELPWTTRVLIGTTWFATHYWWLLLVIFIGLVIASRMFIRTPRGKYFFDKLKLSVPILGLLYQQIYLVRFTRSFGTILVGGVTIPAGLRIVRDVIGNAVYEDIIDETIKEVEDGNPISSVFLKRREIPSMVAQMFSVGEQTGRLDDVLEKISLFYVREINKTVENVLTLIEPAIMVVLGLGVGVMVAGILLPMYTLTSQF